jgi:hypothetical protein
MYGVCVLCSTVGRERVAEALGTKVLLGVGDEAVEQAGRISKRQIANFIKIIEWWEDCILYRGGWNFNIEVTAINFAQVWVRNCNNECVKPILGRGKFA